VGRCLEKEPGARFPDMRAFSIALREARAAIAATTRWAEPSSTSISDVRAVAQGAPSDPSFTDPGARASTSALARRSGPSLAAIDLASPLEPAPAPLALLVAAAALGLIGAALVIVVIVTRPSRHAPPVAQPAAVSSAPAVGPAPRASVPVPPVEPVPAPEPPASVSVPPSATVRPAPSAPRAAPRSTARPGPSRDPYDHL
jgi:hypothetical protein